MGVGERGAHGVDGAGAVGMGHVMGVRGGAAAEDFCERLGATGCGVGFGFEDEDGGAFAEHHAVAASREGAATIFSEGAEGLPRHPGADGEGCFRSTNDGEIKAAVADHGGGFGNGVGGGGAGARDAETGSPGRKSDGDLASRGAWHLPGNGHGVQGAGAADEEPLVGLLDTDESAAAASDKDAGFAEDVWMVEQPGCFERLIGCEHGVDGGQVHLFQQPRVEAGAERGGIGCIDPDGYAVDRSIGNTAFALERAGSIVAIAEATPGCVDTLCKAREAAETGDQDAPAHEAAPGSVAALLLTSEQDRRW